MFARNLCERGDDVSAKKEDVVEESEELKTKGGAGGGLPRSPAHARNNEFRMNDEFRPRNDEFLPPASEEQEKSRGRSRPGGIAA